MTDAAPQPAPSVGSHPWVGMVACYVLLATVIGLYAMWVGPVAFWGDSYLFADRAKHLFWRGNLDLANHGNLIYPPLYSIAIAPLYALGDAASIVRGITLLNSLLIASAVFPLSALLERYARLSGWERWFFAVVLTISPTFVAYAPMILSEALFIPVLYWTAYTLFRSLTDRTAGWFASAGLLMAVAVLIRSAATGVVMAGIAAWLWHGMVARSPGFPRFRLLASGIGGFLLPVVAWSFFEKNHVTYQGGMSYSIGNALRALLGNPADQLIKFHWTLNAGAYFATASLSAAGVLSGILICRRASQTCRDPLIPFAVAVSLLAIASIVVLAPTAYGGNPLTWNKYFAPYIPFGVIVALRLRPLVDRSTFILTALAYAALPWVSVPSGLVCHFPDALSGFMDSATPLISAARVRDGLFAGFALVTLPLFWPGARLWTKVLGALAISLATIGALSSAGNYWRQPGLLNLAGHDGMAARVREAQAAQAGLPVYYDPGMLKNEIGEAHRFLFYTPELLPAVNTSALLLGDPSLPARFFYVTRATIPTARLLARDGESLKLYEIDNTQVRLDVPYTIMFAEDVGGEESVPINGRPTGVRWLGTKPRFSLRVDQRTSAVLSLRLSTADVERRVQATLNGNLLPGAPSVSRMAWRDGFDQVEWTVMLEPGENWVALSSDQPPVVLPDGVRRVTLLLVGEPVIARP